MGEIQSKIEKARDILGWVREIADLILEIIEDLGEDEEGEESQGQ